MRNVYANPRRKGWGTDRVNRQDRVAYRFILNAPIAATVLLPANGSFQIHSATQPVGDVFAMTVTGATTRQMYVPDGQDGVNWQIDNLEKHNMITMQPGFELQLHLGLGKYVTIARG